MNTRPADLSGSLDVIVMSAGSAELVGRGTGTIIPIQGYAL